MRRWDPNTPPLFALRTSISSTRSTDTSCRRSRTTGHSPWRAGIGARRRSKWCDVPNLRQVRSGLPTSPSRNPCQSPRLRSGSHSSSGAQRSSRRRSTSSRARTSCRTGTIRVRTRRALTCEGQDLLRHLRGEQKLLKYAASVPSDEAFTAILCRSCLLW